MQRLYLAAEYAFTILWNEDAEGPLVVEIESLPISKGLQAALYRWAETYDKTLDPEEPQNAGFASPADHAVFDEEGLRLWKRLRTELGPDWHVSYVRDGDGFLFE